jgi:hypothetical protein
MKTLVLGASTNPERYAYKAIRLLRSYKHSVMAVGLKQGRVEDVQITNEWPLEEFDTLTIYLSARHQKEYYRHILNSKPRRIIFNPGAENDELKKMAEKIGIKTEEACTLVLLNTGQY